MDFDEILSFGQRRQRGGLLFCYVVIITRWLRQDQQDGTAAEMESYGSPTTCLYRAFHTVGP